MGIFLSGTPESGKLASAIAAAEQRLDLLSSRRRALVPLLSSCRRALVKLLDQRWCVKGRSRCVRSAGKLASAVATAEQRLDLLSSRRRALVPLLRSCGRALVKLLD